MGTALVVPRVEWYLKNSVRLRVLWSRSRCEIYEPVRFPPLGNAIASCIEIPLCSIIFAHSCCQEYFKKGTNPKGAAYLQNINNNDNDQISAGTRPKYRITHIDAPHLYGTIQEIAITINLSIVQLHPPNDTPLMLGAAFQRERKLNRQM